MGVWFLEWYLISDIEHIHGYISCLTPEAPRQILVCSFLSFLFPFFSLSHINQISLERWSLPKNENSFRSSVMFRFPVHAVTSNTTRAIQVGLQITTTRDRNKYDEVHMGAIRPRLSTTGQKRKSPIALPFNFTSSTAPLSSGMSSSGQSSGPTSH